MTMTFHPIQEVDQQGFGGREGVPGLSDINQMGYFGNIWVRSHHYKKAGDTNGGGHRHNFDHVTLLAKGSIRVEVDGFEPKEFTAPTFIIIKKEHRHMITALEDDVVYYCVFALRDVDGDVTDIYSGDNSPYSHAKDETPVEQRLADLEKKTMGVQLSWESSSFAS